MGKEGVDSAASSWVSCGKGEKSVGGAPSSSSPPSSCVNAEDIGASFSSSDKKGSSGDQWTPGPKQKGKAVEVQSPTCIRNQVPVPAPLPVPLRPYPLFAIAPAPATVHAYLYPYPSYPSS